MALSRRSFLLRSGMTAAGLIGFSQWGDSFNAAASSQQSFPSSLDTVSIPLRDWSGFTVLGESAVVLAPRTEEEVVQIVRQCRSQNRQCRVVGRRTSWNVKWFGDPDTVIVSTVHLDELSFDRDAGTVTCGPGVVLETLHREAWARGLTLSTSPAPPWVTVGGAVSTGSHGSLMGGSLSSSLTGCRLVNGEGSVVAMDAEHPDMDAARISMGMLGVMTQLTLKLDPAYRLTLVQQPIATADWRQELVNSGPMSFIHASTTDAESTLFKVGPEAAANPLSDKVVTGKDAQGHVQMSGPAHLLVMNYQPPSPTIAGGEWAVPVELFPEVMMAFQSNDLSLPSMVWLKKVMGESAYLGGGSDPQKVYVQCGAYHEVAGNQNPQVINDMVRKIEKLMIQFEGRPHFAKLVYMSSDEISKVYPELQRFQEARRRFDPANVFYTQRLAKLFG